MNPNIRLQPHLGRTKEVYKPQNNMSGKVMLAKVLKVHHKSGTADVQVVRTGEVVSSDETVEGRLSARIAVSSAHFNAQNNSSSGVVEPIQEGQLVILAFLDGLKNQPIIIGSFHNTWNSNTNVLPTEYPYRPEKHMDDYKESLKYLRVYPSQYYEKVDGIGGVEKSHPSKTFFKMDLDMYNEISDTHRGYDHQDLTEKNPISGMTRSGASEESSLPVKMLFSHRTSFDNDTTTWTKFFIDSSGLFRVTRDNNDSKLSYIEMSDKGSISIIRQLDSSMLKDSNNYSSITMNEDGRASINRHMEDGTSEISIGSDGEILLRHKNGSYIKLDSSSDIKLEGAASSTVYVGTTEPLNASDGTFWIDTSDIS